MSNLDLALAQQRIDEFVRARDWTAFHTPKNLAMALSAEAGELLAEFQWLTPEESEDILANEGSRARVLDEIADVTIYLLRLADVLGVDVLQAVELKLDRNETRFPPADVRGRAVRGRDLDRA